MADRSGKQLGNYRLLRLLGTGGFAEVYLAEHIFLKTPVAIKLLHAQLETNDMTGFLTEAQTIARLKHSHIVRVTDFGMDGDLPYLVMEYAPNGTLRQRHPRGTPLAFSTIAPYVKQVADALQYAHNEKLIHRDIKPENMLLGYNNEVLPSDFGIATVAHRTSTQNTSVIAGTAVYMAPELFRGKSYPASDQYALAVVVYEWLSGEPPFYEGDFIQLGYQHTYVPPDPLSDKIPTISKDVNHIVTTALAKDPKQRFGSVQAFANAFEQASQGNQGYIAPVRPIPKPTLPAPTEEISQANQSYIAPVRPLSKPLPPAPTEGISQANQSYITPMQPILTPPPQKSTGGYIPPVDSDVVLLPTEGGIEKHGIERVSPATRTHVRIFDNFTMWLSANMITITVSIGALAIPVFGLGFWDSLAGIIIFNLLGVLPVAFFATLGPKLGLRQMTISRFSFGWIGAGVTALFNVVTCIVVLAVNAVVGGQLVASLSNGAIPIWQGVVIIALLTTLVSFFGYRYLHRYQRYAWIPIAIIFVILFILAAPHARMLPPATLGGLEVASFITFGGAIFGFATGWGSYAADYNVNQPEDTPTSRIFWLTFLGIFIPCVLLETLGMLITSSGLGQLNSNEELFAYYLRDLGGFGTFLIFILALSIIANNIPSNYSMGLSMQVIGKAFQRINRVIWTLIGAIVYIIIAIQASASSNFNLTLSNFLLMIAYWVGPWSIILILEHFFFRHGKYNVDDWNTPSRLPRGWAATVSMVVGLFGVYLGAAQANFVGPIANLFDHPFGMDIGFELGIIFAAISYFFLRRLELNAHRK